jgi:hypothetical protein
MRTEVRSHESGARRKGKKRKSVNVVLSLIFWILDSEF